MNYGGLVGCTGWSDLLIVVRLQSTDDEDPKYGQKRRQKQQKHKCQNKISQNLRNMKYLHQRLGDPNKTQIPQNPLHPTPPPSFPKTNNQIHNQNQIL